MKYAHIRTNGKYKSGFLDSVGDGSGTIDMNVDASVTPMLFRITAGEKETLLVNRLLLHLGDTGTLDAGKYGNSLVLTNGIEVGVMRGGVVIEDLTKGHPVITNADWAAFCYDVTDLGFGLGDNFLAVRWTFTKDGEALRLDEGDSFFMKIQDNLSGLTAHHCRLGMTSLIRE